MPDESKMKSQPDRRRLFVGGLHENVTLADIEQRFGKFGSVTSVDVRTKRDSQGMSSAERPPIQSSCCDYKLASSICFLGYINLSCRCIDVELNKVLFDYVSLTKPCQDFHPHLRKFRVADSFRNAHGH